MLAALEWYKRLVQPVGLPVRLSFAPVARVSRNAKDELVVSQILGALVGISATSPRRAHQGKPQGVVIGLIGSVFAIGENGDTESAALIGQINPLM